MQPETSLKRALSLPQLTLYGLGTILGAGIYALIGKITGEAGLFTPISFALAVVIAGFTAVSYAELSARYPRSAGEAIYVEKGFSRAWLSGAVGWAVVLVGLVSAATVTHGFVGYLKIFVVLPDWIVIFLVVASLGAVAAWGIRQSVGIANLITLLEIMGLLMVVLAAGDSLGDVPRRLHEMLPPFTGHAWTGITFGAFLAFYAFIGFEDMVNVAEEVKNPSRTIPLAIFLALGITTVLYSLVALVAVLSLPVDTLAQSEAPLAIIIERKAQWSPVGIGLISLVAMVNGALIQIIMASRVVYGMSCQGVAPRVFSAVSPLTRTPVIATAAVTFIVLVLALWLPIVTLAGAASTIILAIFALVNLSLVRVKRREGTPEGLPSYPLPVPIIGFMLCVGFLVLQLGWVSVG